MSSEKLPDQLVRLWRLPTGPRLGRPAELDVDRVVGTAVALADRAGLHGATLPKIAAALGVTPMSLYRHIGSKDELNDLMADHGLGSATELAVSQGGWRADLRRWALAQLEVFRRHPWLTQLPISGPPRGPNAIDWMDAGLRALRGTKLDSASKVGVIMVVSGYVRQGFVLAHQLEHGSRAAGLDQTQVEQNYGRDLARLVDPGRYPDAAQLFGSTIFEEAPAADGSDDHDFTFGLELVLDGVAAAILDAEPGADGSA
ncbi:TetR/AcrR family transcriptional regulator [Nocardia sp. NPDC051463]|uniref:TetR/AcrR family transcriptional regulator n=1 Tax=Nocardia sp. NPDC051463 TaxID=3154845 RepID=UPI0034369817